MKRRRYDKGGDAVTMSDTTILMTIENLISIAMGPAQENVVNFKLLEKILRIFARHSRLLEQRIEVSIKDIDQIKEMKEQLQEQVAEKRRARGSRAPSFAVADVGSRRKSKTTGRRSKSVESSRSRKGTRSPSRTQSSTRSRSTPGTRSASGKQSDTTDVSDDEPRQGQRGDKREDKRGGGKGGGQGGGRGGGRDDQDRDQDRGSTRTGKRPSIEVVTQQEFKELEKMVDKLLSRSGPPPLPSMPKSKKLMEDIAKGSASLTDVMQAMQLAARVDATEKALERMAQMMTALALSGALPKDLADSVKSAAEKGLSTIGKEAQGKKSGGKGGGKDDYDEDDAKGGRRGKEGRGRGDEDDKDGGQGGKRGRDDDDIAVGGKAGGKGKGRDDDNDDRGAGGKEGGKRMGRDFGDDDRAAGGKTGGTAKGRDDVDDREGGKGGGKGKGRDFDDDDRAAGGKGGGKERGRDDDDGKAAGGKAEGKGKGRDDVDVKAAGGKGGGKGQGRDYDDDDRAAGGKAGGKGKGRDDDDDRAAGGKAGGKGQGRDNDDDDKAAGGKAGGKGKGRDDDDDRAARGKAGEKDRDHDDDRAAGGKAGGKVKGRDDVDDRDGVTGGGKGKGREYDDQNRGDSGKAGGKVKGRDDRDDEGRGGGKGRDRDYGEENALSTKVGAAEPSKGAKPTQGTQPGATQQYAATLTPKDTNPIGRSDMNRMIEDLKQQMMKSLASMTSKTISSAETAVALAKTMAAKQDEVLTISNRMNKLQNTVSEYAGQLQGFDSGLSNQFTNFNEQMSQIKKELAYGLQQLEAVNTNSETAAVAELMDHYHNLCTELENALHNHNGLLSAQMNLAAEIEAMDRDIEILREEKADLEEVRVALRDKADISKLEALLSEDVFLQIRANLESKLEACYVKFQKQNNVWEDAMKELTDLIHSKADMDMLLKNRDNIQVELNEMYDKIKELDILIGEPEAALLSRQLAVNAVCGACMVNAHQNAIPEHKPPCLRPVRPPNQVSLSDTKEDNICKREFPPDYRDHMCNRWVGGSHTILTDTVSRRKAQSLDYDAPPVKRYDDFGSDGKVYKLAQELMPCQECNVVLPPLKKESPVRMKARPDHEPSLTQNDSRGSLHQRMSQQRLSNIRRSLQQSSFVTEDRPTRISLSTKRESMSRRSNLKAVTIGDVEGREPSSGDLFPTHDGPPPEMTDMEGRGRSETDDSGLSDAEQGEGFNTMADEMND